MYERLSVPEAARRLGITEGAVRQRINRGTLEHDKDADGRVYVFIHDTHGEQYGVGDTNLSTLVEELREQNHFLRERLTAAEERDRETRRIIAALTQRIPELPPPDTPSPEPRESPQTASEEPSDTQAPQEEERRKRSFWRRLFGTS